MSYKTAAAIAGAVTSLGIVAAVLAWLHPVPPGMTERPVAAPIAGGTWRPAPGVRRGTGRSIAGPGGPESNNRLSPSV